MITVDQVKKHSELSLRKSSHETDYSQCRARLLYFHNERLSKLAIICPLPEVLIEKDVEHVTEAGISLFIEWQKFTQWINKHDDLEESNLLTAKQYVDYAVAHKSRLMGRNGTLNLITNKVIDHNKMILV